jgi:hypothetical protein
MSAWVKAFIDAPEQLLGLAYEHRPHGFNSRAKRLGLL